MSWIRIIAIAIVAVFTVGCGVAPEAVVSLREAVSAASAHSPIGIEDDETIDAGTQFEPQYPDRVDPFTFASEELYSDSQQGTTITSAAQVDILGFADVGEPQVLIRAKDLTRILGVGDVHDGVEVIAIHPPAVKLRMGNLEWTATMFDKTSADRE